jgi:hypothetical protein
MAFICWSPELRLFCAVSANGTGNRVCLDGVTWTARTSAAIMHMESVCWAPGLYICAVAASASLPM